MNKTSFEVLRFLSENTSTISQRLIAEETHYSLGTINKTIGLLQQSGFIDQDYLITEIGYQALEPYKVKNAIILAAGMSTRFIPVSYELPKGLISVKGDIMIERLIEQLQAASISEIVVVIGYMMEKFFYLRSKYGVKLVVNNEFATKNTHSSIYVSRDYLSNTYICCSDNYYPQNMFHKYEYRSFYCSIFLPGTSYVERAFTFDKSGLIIDTNKPSHDKWIMYGHAYFDRDFTRRFIPILESYFGRPGIEYMYWETIYAENVKDLPMYIQKCTPQDILEFDSMDELQAFDKDYILNNRIKIFENICSVLKCSISDISDIVPIRKGLNNQCFRFTCKGEKYIYRHPGVNAEGVIDRHKEARALRIAKKLGVDDTLLYIDEEEGWKISRFIEVTEEFDFGNKQHVSLLASELKKLHSSKETVGFEFDYEKEAERIFAILKQSDPRSYQSLLVIKNSMQPILDYLKKNPWQVSLCHNDLYAPNLLVSNEQLEIIDWEFSGDSDIGYDICKLFAVHNPPFEEINQWTYGYFGRNLTTEEKLHLATCTSVMYYYWYVWGIYGNKNKEDVAGYMIAWFDKMNQYRDIATKMMEVIN